MADAPRPKLAPVRKVAGRTFGAGQPLVFRPLLSFAEGGPDPFDTVECWPTDRAWCFVGTNDADAGSPRGAIAGVALTLRLARRPGETMPPAIGVELLQRLARDALRDGTPLVSGLSSRLDASLESHDGQGELAAVLFVADEELHAHAIGAAGPCFVAAVLVTEDELEAARDGSIERFAAALAERLGGLVTDVDRRSCLEDSGFASRVHAAVDRDGSSHGEASIAHLSWSRGPRGGLRIAVSEDALPALARMARGRLPFGRPFRLLAPGAAVVFIPEGLTARDAREDERAVVVEVGKREIAALRAHPPMAPGAHVWPELSGLVLVVEPSALTERPSGTTG